MIINVSTREFHTILAALRYYQADIWAGEHDQDQNEIATDGEQETALDAPGIDTLCERINTCGPQVFFIRNKFDHELWWSNETGWGSCAGADAFDNQERLELNAPIDGIWCPLEDLPIEVDRLNRVALGLKLDIKAWENSG